MEYFCKNSISQQNTIILQNPITIINIKNQLHNLLNSF